MRQSRDNKPETLAGLGLPNVSVFIDRAIDNANLHIRLANHIPVQRGRAGPPDFTGDDSEFGDFIDRNFPRGKYASLRRNLDKAARRKVITPVQLYRYIVLVGNLLRAVAIIMEPFALLRSECPALRICDCGKLFVPRRKDKWTCSTTCADRIRQARWRETSERYKANRVRKENEAERQRKAR